MVRGVSMPGGGRVGAAVGAATRLVLAVALCGCGMLERVTTDVVVEIPEDREDGRVGSPLAGPHGGGSAHALELGTVMTDGMLVVHPDPGVEIVLESVEPVFGGAGGLEFVDAFLVRPQNRTGMTQLITTYPPTAEEYREVEPLHGARIDDSEDDEDHGFVILTSFEIVGEGRSTVTEMVVRYRADGDERAVSFVNTLAICVGTGASSNDCELEYGRHS